MNNIELWEQCGRVMLVNETAKLGYRGIERVWFPARERETGIHSRRFRADAIDFDALERSAQYAPMTADDIRALYEQEGQPGAAVNVASCDGEGVDVWDEPQSEAAKWYLGDES